MAYVEVDESMMWTALEGQIQCSEIVVMDTGDTPYMAIDFASILDRVDNLTISSVATPTVQSGGALTIVDENASNDGKRVSFRVSVNAGAGDYVLNVTITLSKGTTNTITRRALLRIV